MPGWQQTAPPRSNGLATASLVCGILGVFLCFTFVLPLLAVIFGLVARSAISKSNGMQTGTSRATWGTVLGVVGLLACGWLVAVGLTTDQDDNGVDDFSDLGDMITGDLDLAIGECVMLPDDTVVFDVDTVPCAQPHEGEVYASGTLGPAGSRPYPGDAAVVAEVDAACVQAFAPYVGSSFDESALGIYYLYPREVGWDVDTGYTCIATAMDGSMLTGTVKGSGR